MVGDEGQVKVLDFGLAKLQQEEVLGAAVDSGTATAFRTRDGLVPGTAAYMSPEQAAGRPVDHRSDIFSLGIVLYEMATGVHPFWGRTAAELATSICEDTPRSVTELRPTLPRHLGRIVRHGLEKDVRRRYQEVLDLKNDLEDLRRELDSGELVAGASPGAATRSRWRRPAYLGAAALASAGVIGGWLFLARPEPPRPALRARPLTSWPGSERHPALSPRGDQIAFVWDGGERQAFDLYVMLLSSNVPLRLTDGPGEVGDPAWSPDGSEIAFPRRLPAGGSRIERIPALGGPGRVLWTSSATSAGQLDWSPDGRLLAFVERSATWEPGKIVLLSMDSGDSRVVTPSPAAAGAITSRLPVFSPDGTTLAYVHWYETPRSDIYLYPVAGGAARRLLSHESWIEGMDWMPDSAALLFSVPWQGATGLWRASMAGAVSQLGFGQDAGDLTIAASGDRLVFSQDLMDSNIWRIGGPAAADRAPPQQLIASTRDDWAPRYSPGGDRIALVSNRSGDFQIWICDGDGRDCSQYETPAPASSPCWSPDGKRLAFAQETDGRFDIFVGDLEGGFPRRLTADEGSDYPDDWSPDGRWIYFRSRRSGSEQIWRVAAAGGEPQQITTGGGGPLAISEDNRFVYYRKAGRVPGIWQVPVGGGPESLLMERDGLGRHGFALRRNSLVYLAHGGAGTSTIERLDLATGRSEPIAELAGTRLGDLSLSPGGRWILFARNDARGGDLILVENLAGGRIPERP